MPMSSTEPIEILFKDDHLSIVNKPSGIPVQPDGTGDPSLLDRLSEQLRSSSIGLVHRIDRPVSGVVLFALDPHTLRIMNEQFKERRVKKIYWAIVEGKWEGSERMLEHWLEHDPKAKKARISKKSEGQPSRLKGRLLAQGDRFALIEVIPEGGAFHQIRAQLAAASHPIKGDVKYGARRGEKDRSISLHARSIEFHHPATDELVRIEAPARTDGIWPVLVGMI